MILLLKQGGKRNGFQQTNTQNGVALKVAAD